MGGLDTIRFEEEPEELFEATAAKLEASNRIVGRITRCGAPAAGVRVDATGLLTIGIETDFKPCLKSTSTRRLGSTTVSADGTYSISYKPSPPDSGFCAYSARVRIDVLQDGVNVYRSPEQREQSSVRFDRELFPDCTDGRSIILVFDSSGRSVPGAEVFHNGVLRGRTGSQGTLAVESLSVGDRLVARLLLNEHATDRGGHSEGSTRDWSHRSYRTSLRVRHDTDGNNVSLGEFIVADTTAVQRVQLSSLNTLIGFNLLVSIEWDSTAQEIRRYTDRLREMSELLYNATDGQFLVERLAVFDNRRFWDDADIRIYADLNQHSQADVGDLFSGGGRIHMNPHDSHEPGVTLHELGHYAFNVRDEYKGGQCTLASQGPGTDFSAGGSKDSCLMRGARTAELKKICSTHPSNPHVAATRQGPRDCWSEIVDLYGDPRWRLRTPVDRGAVVDLFPDSGVPLATSTQPPTTAGAVDSYIPIAAWKPIVHTSSVVRPGECQDLIVRVERDGSPRNEVKVWLESGTVKTYQGITNPYDRPYGLTTGPGEIPIRGAHVGDRLSAVTFSSGGILHGSVEVEDCGQSPLVLPLQRSGFPFTTRMEAGGPGEIRILVDVADAVSHGGRIGIGLEGADPISVVLPSASQAADASLRGRLTGLPEKGSAELEVAVPDRGSPDRRVWVRSSFATVRGNEGLDVFSPDGRLELSLPAGALPGGTMVVVDTAAEWSPPPDRYGIVGDAYRITTFHAARLDAEATLDFNLNFEERADGRTRRALLDPAILRLIDGAHGWEIVAGQITADSFVSVAIDRLGTYALAAVQEASRAGALGDT